MEKFGSASSRVPPAPAWRCAVALVLALATVVAVDARSGYEAASTGNNNVTSVVSSRVAASSSTRKSVTLICRSTPYPGACKTALASAEAHRLVTGGDPFAASMHFTMSRATSARAMARRLAASAARSLPPSGFHDCAELLEMSVRQLRDALAGSASDVEGATTWLSAALTNQDTCTDSLAAVPPASATTGRDALRRRVAALARFISTALALHVGKVKESIPPSAAPAPSSTTFPSWVTEHDRRLLESPAANITPDAVVAQDGSGTHRSIGEAIAAVTTEAASAAVGAEARGGVAQAARKVIYVKAGKYVERVSVTYQQENVMLVGEGKGRTIIESHNSVAGGYTTLSSATIAAMGAGFMARGLSIVNSAGRDKEQAVALLVTGDRSVVYQCEIKAYQDTLFTHSNRQFYADTDIAGTVDFIFGNSAAVFQGCNIQARGPVPGQQDVVTAQGRDDPNQNTGFSFHRCRITGAPDLGKTPVYLGRPWRKYARVVVMKSYMDGLISPAGWLAWSDPAALSTLYYGEYGNSGPGAGTNGRVAWKGVHRSMSAAEANEFTVAKLISGDSWLESTGVRYTSGL
ncbi:hypothetical protein PR202_ga02978 [Eleusine coracana subsp. coracana]|uniref:Pectinesterase n=1 Tax=Eleusine coracana subsp. coracana TaxID=191504 RepID=A0AAV5BL67_ELECO|nr:hypothetical protein PR202_ga02978 [Eleusine coracana subsp. coracana]